MAKDKKSFVLYCDLIHTVNKLSDEDSGKLLKHLLKYVNDEDPQTDSPIVDIVFEPIKQQLKRDLKDWESKINKRREAGKKGGLAKASNAKQELANLAVNDTVTVTVNDTINFKSLVDFINKVGNRSFKTINDKAKRAYNARIKEGYTKEDIQKAITNAYKEPYHIESSFKYLTPEFFSRAEKIDMYSVDSKRQNIDLLVLKASISIPAQMKATCEHYGVTEQQVKAMYASKRK